MGDHHDASREGEQGLFECTQGLDVGDDASVQMAASRFIRDTFEPTRYELPAMLRGVYFTSGTQVGTPLESLLRERRLTVTETLAVGLNCATGPDLMTDHMRTIHDRARVAVSC